MTLPRVYRTHEFRLKLVAYSNRQTLHLALALSFACALALCIALYALLNFSRLPTRVLHCFVRVGMVAPG